MLSDEELEAVKNMLEFSMKYITNDDEPLLCRIAEIFKLLLLNKTFIIKINMLKNKIFIISLILFIISIWLITKSVTTNNVVEKQSNSFEYRAWLENELIEKQAILTKQANDYFSWYNAKMKLLDIDRLENKKQKDQARAKYISPIFQ